MDPYVDLLTKPTRTRWEPQFCRLWLDLDPKSGKETEDNFTILAAWTLPTGWGLGGIDWQLDKRMGRIEPVKASVYCEVFECEQDEER
jgi:hypothetical protein